MSWWDKFFRVPPSVSAREGAALYKPRWTHIMIHHSATKDTDHVDTAVYRTHHTLNRGWRGIGYHLIVERIANKYQVVVGRPLDWDGAHCPGWNQKAIGIVFAGNFNKKAPSEQLLAWGVKYALKPMMEIFDIPKENILLHREHRQTECPGKYMTRELILTALRKY